MTQAKGYFFDFCKNIIELCQSLGRSLTIIYGVDKLGQLKLSCLKCKQVLDPSKGGFFLNTWIPNVKGIPGYPNRDVYVYALCNRCFEVIQRDKKWLDWIEDEIVLIEKNAPHLKCGDK